MTPAAPTSFVVPGVQVLEPAVSGDAFFVPPTVDLLGLGHFYASLFNQGFVGSSDDISLKSDAAGTDLQPAVVEA